MLIVKMMVQQLVLSVLFVTQLSQLQQQFQQKATLGIMIVTQHVTMVVAKQENQVTPKKQLQAKMQHVQKTV